jgi:hypothetical protein
VTAVNDEPSFTSGGSLAVLEDSGAYSVGWASAISMGPANEGSQTRMFNVIGNTNPGLFGVGPVVAADGTLSFTPASDVNGSADVTVELVDDGGTANGGDDISTPATFTITVSAVNDEPSFTPGSDLTVLVDSGAFTVAGWATGISAGPADESGQTLTFTLTGDTNPSLFTGPPSINSSGDLIFSISPAQIGSADLTFVLEDDGGVANGGIDTSTPATFTITVTAAPSVFYLHNNPTPPTGDTSSHTVLPFDGTAPTASVLYNYDTDRDTAGGLVLAKSGLGLSEIDSTKYQIWSLPGWRDLDGNAVLTLWSAMKSFDTTGRGVVLAALLDCASDGSDCNTIATGALDLDPWDSAGSGSWLEKTIDFGTVTHTIGAARTLRIKIVVESNAGDDMWFAYGTTSYDSHLQIG